MRGNNIFKILTLGALIFLGGMGSRSFADDVLPWPWGTECPFPWANFSGEWRVSQVDGLGMLADSFEFNVLGTSGEGDRNYYFEIKRWNREGELVARGRGFALEKTRIIRAALISQEADGSSNSYWAIVRGYQSKKSSYCRNDITMVLTLRPIEGSDQKDSHYVIEKVRGVAQGKAKLVQD
ncbi:MAG: hypothetical protein KDD22_01350 [Bdellovibrionales bacterium]|nr:hypothetical protein [Bdellovibrionales bacterium]